MELFLSVLVGLVAIPIIQYVKNKLGWDDRKALVLSAALSAVLSIGALFLYGKVGIADFTLANFPAVFSLVYATASFVYKLITSGRSDVY